VNIKKWITGKQLADIYIGYIKKYGIVSIEDPFDQGSSVSFHKIWGALIKEF
jgi:enolase